MTGCQGLQEGQWGVMGEGVSFRGDGDVVHLVVSARGPTTLCVHTGAGPVRDARLCKAAVSEAHAGHLRRPGTRSRQGGSRVCRGSRTVEL